MEITIHSAARLHTLTLAHKTLTANANYIPRQTKYVFVAEGTLSGEYHPDFPQPFQLTFHGDNDLCGKLWEEVLRESHLNESGASDLTIDEIVFHCGLNVDWRDRVTHKVHVKGTGRHSKIMYDPLPFEVSFHADVPVCTILREILMKHLGMHIEVFPRE